MKVRSESKKLILLGLLLTIFLFSSGALGPIFSILLERNVEVNDSRAIPVEPSRTAITDDGGKYQDTMELKNEASKELTVSAGTPTVMWTHVASGSSGYLSFGSPAISDINNDNKLEVLMGANDGPLVAFDALTGTVLWQTTVSIAGSHNPTLADINGDGVQEIFFKAVDAKIYAVSGTNGAILWSTATSGTWGDPSIGDVDGDGTYEIVTGANNVLHAINAEDGTIAWNHTLSSGTLILSIPSIGDINGDGTVEVAFGTRGTGADANTVFVLNGVDGSLTWSFHTSGIVDSTPVIADVDGDDKPEVIFGSVDNNVYVLNGEDGSISWTFTTNGDIPATPAVGDIDLDRKLEVIIGSTDTKVYALNGEDGSLAWSFSTSGWVHSSASLADINGDNRLDVLVGSNDDNLYALNGNNGSLIWSFNLGSDVTNSPSLADVDNDSRLEIFIASVYNNKIYALDVSNAGNLAYWQAKSGDDAFHRSNDLLSVDADEDFLSYRDELIIGTNPSKNDTDGDGYLDGFEVMSGSDPLNPSDHVNVVASLPIPVARSGIGWDPETQTAYLFGGIYGTGTNLSYLIGSPNIIKFSPQNNSAVILTDINLPVGMYGTAVVYHEQSFYLFGGVTGHYPQGGFTYYSHIFRFDPKTRQLVQLNVSLPYALEGILALSSGSDIYLFGGYGGSGNPSALRKIMKFNPLTETMEIMNATLPDDFFYMQGFYDGRYFYMLGGYDAYGDLGSTAVYRYDPLLDTLETLNLTFHPRGVSLVHVDGNAYIFGGTNQSLNTYLDTILEFSPQNLTLELLDVTLPIRLAFSSAFTNGTDAFLLGGHVASNPWTATDVILRWKLPSQTRDLTKSLLDHFDDPVTGYNSSLWDVYAYNAGSITKKNDTVLEIKAWSHSYRALISKQQFTPGSQVEARLSTDDSGIGRGIGIGWSDARPPTSNWGYYPWQTSDPYVGIEANNAIMLITAADSLNAVRLAVIKDNQYTYYSNDYPVDTSQFHVYRLVWNASWIGVYIDGILVDEVTNASLIPTASMPLVINNVEWIGGSGTWLWLDDVNVTNLTTTLAHSLISPVLTHPNGGEVLSGVVNVGWQSSVDSWGHAVSYDLYYSSDAGTTWTMFASGLTSTWYLWNTSQVPDGSSYLVRVVATDGQGLSMADVSDGTFSIRNTAHSLSSPVVMYPNGGEVLSGVVNVSWQSSVDSWGHAVRYDLYYSSDGGEIWMLLVSGLTSTWYSWNTSQAYDGSLYLVRVVATDGQGLYEEDVSDDTFSIQNSAQSTTSPTSSSSTTETETSVAASLSSSTTSSSFTGTTTDEKGSTNASSPIVTTTVVVSTPSLSLSLWLVGIVGVSLILLRRRSVSKNGG